MATRFTVRVAALLVTTLVCLGLAEVFVRALVRVNPTTGVQILGRVPLLPYRVQADAVAAVPGEEAAYVYMVPDAELGWSIEPGGAAGQYTATAQGLRGPRGSRTTTGLAPGKVRISAYGDSFTHGDGVALDDTWVRQLEGLAGMEVLNFGVPAYGTDQAFLRYRRDGRKFDAQIHLLGIWPENLARNVNVIRFYLTPQGELGTSKPRFELQAGGLRLINSPVLSRGEFLDAVLQRKASPVLEKDYWYRPQEQTSPFYDRLASVRAARSVLRAYERRRERLALYADAAGEAIRVTVAIASTFAREVEQSGATPYVCIFPMRELLDQQAGGSFPLVVALREKSVPVLDFGPAFAARAKEVGKEALFLPDGHLTPAGNLLVAQETRRMLAQAIQRAGAGTDGAPRRP